jgi:hypothetical protein
MEEILILQSNTDIVWWWWWWWWSDRDTRFRSAERAGKGNNHHAQSNAKKQAFSCIRALVLRERGTPPYAWTTFCKPTSRSKCFTNCGSNCTKQSFWSQVVSSTQEVYSVLPPSLLAADLVTQTCCVAEVVDITAELSCRFCPPHHTRGAYPSFLATDTQTFCWSHAPT